jgi:APA family basic amino acid/polyamine antiporter
MTTSSKKEQKPVTTTKKISYLSSIFLVVGTAIGAGIFLKNGEIINNVGGSIALAIVCWIIAIVGILALGLVLTEICSANKENNKQGIIG